MKERDGIFVKVYQGATCHEPSDVEITHHLECQGQSNIVSWIGLSDHYKANELARKGL